MGKKKNLIWLDLEMTGLCPEQDRILEVATIVTDSDLNTIAMGPDLIVHQSEERLAGMDEWNRTHHGDSGLAKASLESSIDEAQAEQETLNFLAEHVAEGVSPMCGNSICQDRRFLARWMPDLERYFHYRNLDVSTVKELVNRWLPAARPKSKGSAHRALSDIQDSIRELEHYRAHAFRGGSDDS